MIGDTKSFVELARSYSVDDMAFLDPSVPISTGTAPGRLDILGGIADYSGSHVLEMPIAECTYVAIQLTGNDEIEVLSVPSFGIGERRVSIGCREYHSWDYSSGANHFRVNQESAWAAYVIGVLLVLRLELGLSIHGGVKILIASDVPEGKGVSSSASLELAVLSAALSLLSATIDPHEAARFCQLAENKVARAACGIMDQMTVVFGRENNLMLLDCRPAKIKEYVLLPSGLAFWGIDSGVRHAVSGSTYHDVRVGAFMGLRIVQSLPGYESLSYLAELSTNEFQKIASGLPDAMFGSAFTDAYGALDDTATSLDLSRQYEVRIPTRHPVYENERVLKFARLMMNEESDADVLGKLMYASHDAYSACGLGSEATDRLVRLVRDRRGDGLYGAKISGGGSGGTVVVLGDLTAGDAIRDIAVAYRQLSGYKPYVFSGSGSGMLETQDDGSANVVLLR